MCVYGTGTALLMGFWCLYMFVLGFEKSRLFSFFVLADAQICNDLLPWCFLWLVICVFFSCFLGWSETKSTWYIGHYLAYSTSHGR